MHMYSGLLSRFWEVFWQGHFAFDGAWRANGSSARSLVFDICQGLVSFAHVSYFSSLDGHQGPSILAQTSIFTSLAWISVTSFFAHIDISSFDITYNFSIRPLRGLSSESLSQWHHCQSSNDFNDHYFGWL